MMLYKLYRTVCIAVRDALCYKLTPINLKMFASLIKSFTNIKGITLGAGEDVDEVPGGTSGKGVDRISKVDIRVSEGQATGVYGTGFTIGSLARVGARDGTWGLMTKVGSGKELRMGG